nr:kinesin-like protein KIN-14L [Tanacetum cinerariifolium]
MIDFIGEDGTLVLLDPLKGYKNGKKLFQFNRVFGPTAIQEGVFADTRPLIRSVMDGYNCGPSGAFQNDMGINYLGLNGLFGLSDTRKGVVKYELFVQMVEIYNEHVIDLLTADFASTNKLEIHSCTSKNGLSLPDATMLLVKSIVDVLNLMKSGQVNRDASNQCFILGLIVGGCELEPQRLARPRPAFQ